MRNSDAYNFPHHSVIYYEAFLATSSFMRPKAGAGNGLACMDER